MPATELFLIKRFDEFVPKEDMALVPKNTRGIYVLLKKNGKSYNVIYVGMAGGEKAGIHGRLNSHARSPRKKDAWDYFSIFEVHDNISRHVIQELEGFFRHIYRSDATTLQFNKQKKFKKYSNIHKTLSEWKKD